MSPARLRRLLALLLPVVLAAGELKVPRAGYLLEPSGELRPITGIGGNLLLGEAVAHQVRAAAFCGAYGLLGTEDGLLLVGGDLELLAYVPAPSREARLAVSAWEPLGVAWLPETGEICRLRPGIAPSAGCFVPLLHGVVQAVGFAGRHRLSLAVERGRALWLVLVDLESERTVRESLLPAVTPPVALIGEEVLYHQDGELVLRRANGSEIRLSSPVPAPRFQPAGTGWLSLQGDGGGARWVVRISGDSLETFRLPGGGP